MVKLKILPWIKPQEFSATARKKIVVLGLRFETNLNMSVGKELLPKSWEEVLNPSEKFWPYSNQPVVDLPLGVMLALNVADVSEIKLAELVETIGAQPLLLNPVTKLITCPLVVPKLFLADTRKNMVEFLLRLNTLVEMSELKLPEPTLCSKVLIPFPFCTELKSVLHSNQA